MNRQNESTGSVALAKVHQIAGSPALPATVWGIILSAIGEKQTKNVRSIAAQDVAIGGHLYHVGTSTDGDIWVHIDPFYAKRQSIDRAILKNWDNSRSTVIPPPIVTMDMTEDRVAGLEAERLAQEQAADAALNTVRVLQKMQADLPPKFSLHFGWDDFDAPAFYVEPAEEIIWPITPTPLPTDTPSSESSELANDAPTEFVVLTPEEDPEAEGGITANTDSPTMSELPPSEPKQEETPETLPDTTNDGKTTEPSESTPPTSLPTSTQEE